MCPKNPNGRPDFRLCRCTSHDCRGRLWDSDAGPQSGRWVHRNTWSKHFKKDETLRAEGALGEQHDPATAAAAVPPPMQPIPLRSDSPGILETEAADSPSGVFRQLVAMACALGIWLYIVAGLSRDASQKVLKVLGLMLTVAAGALETPLNKPAKVPQSVPTALDRLSIEPVLNRSVCCSSCFQPYSLASLPDICMARESPQSHPCNTPLWTERQTRAGLQRVPARLYTTQDLHSWLTFFLSRPGIEELIRKSQTHTPATREMRSIWDSPSWRNFGDNSFASQPYNLVFSYYIDWFNPFMNKIAGKKVSCGAIMFFCLNLPFEMQHEIDNTFFAGITPPPEPTMTTINALTNPIVQQLREMWDGRVVRTYEHPEGQRFRVGILPAIGDVLALKKALGFTGHTSKRNFCTFCTIPYAEIDRLDWENFPARDGNLVLSQGRQWLFANSEKQRKALLLKNGVRKSAMHDLPYRDPVKHTVLGMMHNWPEGVLQHHARLKWGIGSDAPGSETALEEVEGEDEFEFMDVDEHEVAAELRQLATEAARVAPPQATSSRKRTKKGARTILDPIPDDDRDDPDYSEPSEPARAPPEAAVGSLPENELEDGLADEEDEEAVYEREKPVARHVLTAGSLATIREAIRNVTIPAHIDRPPTNLGQKDHGKLKADNWLVLFSVFLPLIVPELWHDGTQIQERLLDNFHDLISATMIVCSYTVSQEKIEAYRTHYLRYLETSRELFPDLSVRPNHHYAIHNGDQMAWWGPLPQLSEWKYEAHNGNLQKIKTNNHIWEFDLTMLRQICRRGRLLAYLKDNANATSLLGKISRILVPTTSAAATTEQPIAPQESQASRSYTSLLGKQGISLLHRISGSGPVEPPAIIFDLIFEYWNRRSAPQYIRADNLLYNQLGAKDRPRVFPNRFAPSSHLNHNTRVFATSDYHEGNSSIFYIDPSTHKSRLGFIRSMWKIELEKVVRHFLVVEPHAMVSPQDWKATPYARYPGFGCSVAYTHPGVTMPLVVLEPNHVRSHVAFYRRPSGTYGLGKAITVFVNNLHRNRE
uniref:Uncharacterized protein n=1 Tax=Mycena chlorophos TaxID=658473 RepID=A0ABQ0KUK0_MYCCL|nr:predicted protein [Mycena chlorophos]